MGDVANAIDVDPRASNSNRNNVDVVSVMGQYEGATTGGQHLDTQSQHCGQSFQHQNLLMSPEQLDFYGQQQSFLQQQALYVQLRQQQEYGLFSNPPSSVPLSCDTSHALLQKDRDAYDQETRVGTPTLSHFMPSASSQDGTPRLSQF